MKYFKVLILFCFTAGFAFAQNKGLVQIECGAPGYIGKEARIFAIDDYITYERTPIAKATVQPDSVFKTSFFIDKTQQIVVEIDNVEALMYVAPNGSYDMYFPSTDVGGGRKLGGNEVSMYFMSLDTSDVNYKILEFHRWMDDFIAQNAYLRVTNKKLYRQKLDTMFQYGYEYYKNEKDPFVKTYVTYHFAQIEELSLMRKLGDQKLRTYSRYFQGQKVAYDNDQYMLFFNKFFDNFLTDLDYKIENRVYLASLKSSPTLMIKALSKDHRTTNPRIAELVLMKAMKQNFYSGTYPQSNVLRVLDSIKNFSKFEAHKKIASNIIKMVTTLEPGYPAPQLNLRNKFGKLISWSTFKGKYVYLNFFDTKSQTANKEMNLYPSLRDKYGADIEFVSICTDKDTAALQQYLDKNPKFNWKFYNLNGNQELLDRFKVKATPTYFLIDQEGYMVAVPALRPSPNGKYETIDKTFYYIRRALHPEVQFRVGQKED